MFELGSFDLDIDDDFSSNIFSKSVDFASKRNVLGNKIWGKNQIFVESTSNLEKNESSNIQLNNSPNSEAKSSSNNFLDFSLGKGSKENSLKRFHIQDEHPQKKRLSNEGLLQRKFPGPAGLLPDKPFKEFSDLALVKNKITNDKEDVGNSEKEILLSQNSSSMFLESTYQKLVSDFNLFESDNPLNRYTIEWVKKTALSKGFQRRKIPFLGLVLHSVSQGISDSVLVLRDPTGEIHGSLHKEVWADMGGKLKAGIALALRQVGVLVTGVIRRQIYLNITMNNILSLYSSNENESQVEVTTINKVSKLELMRSFEEWLAQSSKNINTKSSLDSPLFTIVNDISLPSNNREEIRNFRNELGNLRDTPMEKKTKNRKRNTEEVLANLGITLTENDFKEEMGVPSMNLFKKEENSVSRTSTQILSQAESLIFEEVLNGINLNEFET